MEQIKHFIENNASAIKYFSFGAMWSVFTFVYAHFRDRVKVKTSSHFFTGRPSVRIKIVNVGSRPIILTGLTFKHDDGSTHGEVLGHPNGLVLKQDEQFSDDFEMDCSSMMYHSETGSSAVDVYFSDTQDRKYFVKGAKKNIELYWDAEDKKAEKLKSLL